MGRARARERERAKPKKEKGKTKPSIPIWTLYATTAIRRATRRPIAGLKEEEKRAKDPSRERARKWRLLR